MSATFGRSFAQPADVDDGEDEDSDGEGQGVSGDSTKVKNHPVDVDGREDDAEPDDGESRAGEGIQGSKDASKKQNGGVSETASSFVTAPVPPKKTRGPKLTIDEPMGRSPPAAGSFVTAQEVPPKQTKTKSTSPIEENADEAGLDVSPQFQPQQSPNASSTQTQNRLSNGLPDPDTNTGSTTRLIQPEALEDNAPTKQSAEPDPTLDDEQGPKKLKPRNTGLVKFNLDQDQDDTENRILNRTASKISQAKRHRIFKRLRRGTAHPGEIVKMEKMLVRVDTTRHQLPRDFDENDSLEIETRTLEKWREFVVVCRESATDDCQFFLQLYKTRVIPAKEEIHVQKSSTHEIRLIPKSTRVNLYSSLDKTVVLWLPWKNQETLIYYLRPHAPASSVEWYTFLRNTLGWKRPSTLPVHVPDLKITLQIENPFGELEQSMNEAQTKSTDDAALSKTMEAEKAVSQSIIHRSLKILEDNPEWADVLSTWLSKERIGLAWKRYDRLEWVHGANEQRMYGSMAMQQTHDLELRPKDHYPTDVKRKKESLVEPPPVEGFLIRLTSRKGTVNRFGKLYYKRLYFVTHNHYLCYMRPAKALPPPPPDLSLDDKGQVPSANEIVHQTPLIYAVNPYPDNNRDGEVDWLQYGTASSKERHDREAYKESERQVNTMLAAEGLINLSHVVRVQEFKHGSSPADGNVDEGSDIDFHEDVTDTMRNDGKTQTLDDKRTFEIVLKNKLVVRLQAYNEATKREWIHRLRDLIKYWKLRLNDDVTMLKTVRGENLERLDIDEEQEAYLGQFGQKWEVTRSLASSKIFNMCGISCCRAITKSGVVYYKPRRHTTFVRCGVILCHGRLMIFQGIYRSRTGEELPSIQHDRKNSIPLQNCYVYSGLITGDDLLYQNDTFDSSHPGHNALPKVYLEDGWTSQDEDTMTCFVIWQPRNKSWFRANEEEDGGKMRQRVRHVSRLGVPGRTIVFRSRSRAERDHWVMSISMEIERLQLGEDIRVVDKA